MEWHVFTILPENLYQRGSLFWLSQLIPFLMYAVDIAIFADCRRHLPRKDFRTLSSYIILPVAAEAVQMLYYGVGFPPAKEKADGRSHIGLENVQERLACLCGGTLEMQSEADNGTVVTITIPKEAVS